MVEPAKDSSGRGGDHESGNPNNSGAPNSDERRTALADDDSPSVHRSVNFTRRTQTEASPATPAPLVYVRRRFEVDTIGKTKPNVATDSQLKQPNVSGFPPPRASAALSTPSVGASAAELTPQGSILDKLNWEDRYHHLQMLLNTLDESDHMDYVQMLRSLSSVELSRHAVQLEKRSIQLSLEEAKEMQRVAALNVLGRS